MTCHTPPWISTDTTPQMRCGRSRHESKPLPPPLPPQRLGVALVARVLLYRVGLAIAAALLPAAHLTAAYCRLGPRRADPAPRRGAPGVTNVD